MVAVGNGCTATILLRVPRTALAKSKHVTSFVLGTHQGCAVMKKAKKATKSLFKGLSRPMRASGSLPFPATTPQALAGGDSGGTPVISTPSKVSRIVEEASSDQIASTLTMNITQTTQSRAT